MVDELVAGPTHVVHDLVAPTLLESPPDAGATRAPVETVTVRFSSNVKGVEVYEGDRRLCVTPCEKKIEKVNREMTVVGEKDGYDFGTAKFNPAIDDECFVRVRKARSGKGKRLHGAGKKAGQDDGGTKPGTTTENPDLAPTPYSETPP